MNNWPQNPETLKALSLVIRIFAAKNATLLKDSQSASGCQQGSHLDKSANDWTLKKTKQQYNPHQQLQGIVLVVLESGTRRRNLANQNNARRQPLEPEDTILEQENTVHVKSDSSGACKHISSQPDPDLDITNRSD